ncbi:5-formyltetrahydrofolate cyclo-ligase [Leucobacter sp. cx-328]|uniref:5-formyltetrahydrofolate cyclo-ligase n=1 Tax=unclassified Leucobacter TaxID=2621730 RepID=UPI00165D67B2|nr:MULTISPECIES: 5-formyltetrahydrofolate cyclo-ligase [unclassified Leucobacter]MBC9943774.1 5-formyltetrahydrofolate cyclo-ligase [Leucobacter sp. cx-328]
MTSSIADEKRALRTRVRALRAAGRGRGSAHTDSLISLVREVAASRGTPVTRVTSFVSVGDEPSTAGFNAWAVAEGIEVLLPRVRPDGQMDWGVLTSAPDGGLAPGAFGIPEPVGDLLPATAPQETDLMLIPAACVDGRGNRLGWGRGFFDRCLAGLATPPPVFAVVFDDEVFEAVPVEPHDAPIAGAVTERQVLRFER